MFDLAFFFDLSFGLHAIPKLVRISVYGAANVKRSGHCS
jgi:hypothetical protein